MISNTNDKDIDFSFPYTDEDIEIALDKNNQAQTPFEPHLFEENFDALEYFRLFNDAYFEGILDCIQLQWSNRMKNCTGVFSTVDNIPIIRLSEPLLKFRQIHEVKETLLHEMIHAYCYMKDYDMSDDLSGHGEHFKLKMHELNKATGLNITVYHAFYDEVDYYVKHIWRCNGKCQSKPPHYGYVQRQINRPPQKADKWWNKHQRECGGTFVKLSGNDGIDGVEGKDTEFPAKKVIRNKKAAQQRKCKQKDTDEEIKGIMKKESEKGRSKDKENEFGLSNVHSLKDFDFKEDDRSKTKKNAKPRRPKTKKVKK